MISKGLGLNHLNLVNPCSNSTLLEIKSHHLRCRIKMNFLFQFLSVAQNKLKSLSMASQPQLQVLAASKNTVSTLKGFPCLPSLEHLRLEENPILELAHVEAASILLVGPTLKKFNDRDLYPKEITYVKLYPAHTAVCIAGAWEFCSSKQAIVKLVVAGFSMGDVVALYSAKCRALGQYGNGNWYPINLSAAVALSGWLPCKYMPSIFLFLY